MSKYHRRSPHENKQAALNSITINREKKKTDEKYVPDWSCKRSTREKAKCYWQLCPGTWDGKHKGVRDIPPKPQVATTVIQSPMTWKWRTKNTLSRSFNSLCWIDITWIKINFYHHKGRILYQSWANITLEDFEVTANKYRLREHTSLFPCHFLSAAL